MIHKGSTCWDPSSQIFQAGDLTQRCASGLYAQILIVWSPLLFCPHYSHIDSTVSNQPWGSVDPRRRSPECSAPGFGSSEAHFWMRFSMFAICSVEMQRVDVISSSLSSHLCPFCSGNSAAVPWSFCDTDRWVHLSELLRLQHGLKLDLRALNHTCCFLTSLLILKSLKIEKSFIHYAHKNNFGSDKFLYSVSKQMNASLCKL